MSVTLPIRQRDIAAACGLHPSTVCLALKNSPAIPEETRQRIHAVAEKLGYQPNVAARNLALLRTERPSEASLPLAWLNQESRRDHWRADPEAAEMFQRARRRAQELGYHLEEIWTREPGMTAARVVQIVRARGIEGVLFPVHRSFDFCLLVPAWNDFALVGCNDHRLAEWIDTVCPDHYRNAGTLLQELRRLGVSRIGLVHSPAVDAATNGLVHSRLLREQADLPSVDRIPVCILPPDPTLAETAFSDWLNEYHPAAVLCRDPALPAIARRLGCNTLFVGWNGGGGEFDTALPDMGGEIAVAAIECLVEKVRRFDRGTRESARLHLIRSGGVSRALSLPEPEVSVA